MFVVHGGAAGMWVYVSVDIPASSPRSPGAWFVVRGGAAGLWVYVSVTVPASSTGSPGAWLVVRGVLLVCG